MKERAWDGLLGADLSQAETRIAQMLVCGRTVPEAAEATGITRKTANTHACKVLCKLGARDRAELVLLAIAKGWTDVTYQDGRVVTVLRDDAALTVAPERGLP